MKPPVKAPLAAHVDVLAGIAGAGGTLLRRWALEEAERAWAAEPGPRRVAGFVAGDTVVYTARFLQLACAQLEPADIARVWTVQACGCDLCALGRHLCTTEWLQAEGAFRHLARAHLRHQGVVGTDDLAVVGWVPEPERKGA
jgi:hypothetical protein